MSMVNSRSEKRIRKTALLTGHLFHDYEYYEKVIRPIVKREFGVEGYLKKRVKRNCVYFVMGNPIFDFLQKAGFPVGKKLQLRIPEVILQNLEFSKACIRGIFNTDGSIYSRYSKQYAQHTRLYDYLVIQFKLNSKEVLEQIRSTFEQVGISANQIISERNSYVLRITRQKDIDKFIEVIRPSNMYHVERYINRCREPKSYGPLAQR